MPFGFNFNLNITYVIIIVVILVIIFYVIRNRYADEGKSKNSKRKGGKSKKNKRTSGKKGKEGLSVAPNDFDVGEAAEELYDALHTGMCEGIQQADYKQLAGEWANNAGLYIELKQLYNLCKDKGEDPMETITVQDYAQVIQRIAA